MISPIMPFCWPSTAPYSFCPVFSGAWIWWTGGGFERVNWKLRGGKWWKEERRDVQFTLGKVFNRNIKWNSKCSSFYLKLEILLLVQLGCTRRWRRRLDGEVRLLWRLEIFRSLTGLAATYFILAFIFHVEGTWYSNEKLSCDSLSLGPLRDNWE